MSSLNPNASQINLRDINSDANTLAEFLTGLEVLSIPPDNTRTVSVGGGNSFVLVPSGILGAGADPNPNVLAVGLQSEMGVVAAELPGVLGTASTNAVTDAAGNRINEVAIVRDSDGTVISTSGRRIFGLLQCPSGTADGTAIGASGSENLQLSFVFEDATGTLVLASLAGAALTIRIGLMRSYTRAKLPQKATLASPVPPGSFGSTTDVIETVHVASTVWTINHDRGEEPASVQAIVGGQQVYGLVDHPSVNQTTITFTNAQAGTSYLIFA